MNKYYTKAKNYITNNKIITVVVLLVLVVVGFKIFSNGNDKKDLYSVKKGDVIQKVTVNGKTKPVDSVDLAFEVAGTVRSLNVSIGSRVYLGQPLVSLDQSGLYADLMKARANVLSEEARLDELKRGTRSEEIEVYETELEKTKTALSDAEKNLLDKVKDVINNNIDQLFVNVYSTTPKFNFIVSDTQLQSDLSIGRLQIESIFKNWSSAAISGDIIKISNFIEKVALAVNAFSSGPSLTQATIDGYKSSISSARATVITANEGLNTAKSNLAVAQKNLNLKKSGNTSESIRIQEAKVLQNQSEVQSIEAKLSKMTLRSPQNGLVTTQDAKIGEVVTSGKVLISIISDSNLEIESNVSEINIGKVAVGSPVSISFDAFTGEVFAGTVTYVEPAETIIDGVVNYKVTVAFNQKYPQMKSGLTSKLEVATATKKDVLVIPQYSILIIGKETFVSKKVDGNFSQIPVVLGLKGQDGFVEVLSGVSAGDILETVVSK